MTGFAKEMKYLPSSTTLRSTSHNESERERLLRVVCVVKVVGGPLYSLERSVPGISLYGNVANRLLEDQISLPAKMHLDGTQGGFGRTTGLAGPTLLPLATVLLWYTA